MFLFIPFVIYLWVINIKKLKDYTRESKGAIQIDNHEKKRKR